MINFTLDRRRKVSLEQQVYELIKRHIVDRLCIKDERLPSLEEIHEKTGLSLKQADSIYVKLIEENFVYQHQRDYYVQAFEVSSYFFDRVHSILEVIELNQMRPSFKDLSLNVVKTPQSLIHKNAQEDEDYLCVERIFYGNEKAVFYTKIYYSLRRFPKLNQQLVFNQEIWPFLIKEYGVNIADVKLEFLGARLTRQQKEILETDSVIGNHVQSFVYDDQQKIVELTDIYTKSDAFHFRIDFDLNS